MKGELLNAGDNVDHHESFGFTELDKSKLHLQLQMTIQNKLNIQQENLIPQRNIDINYKP